MSKKSRYLIIAFCFVFFAIASPLIVMYVRGLSYDFENKRFVKTGILSIETEPKAVDIFLDGKLTRQKAGSLKFLKPKEYLITISKAGFLDWSKRLPVYASQVTWAHPANNKIYLFLQQPDIQTLSSEVLDFYIAKQYLIILEKNKLAALTITNPNTKTTLELPKNVNKIIASPNAQKFALVNTAQNPNEPPTIIAFNRQTSLLTDIGNLFVKQPTLEFSLENELFALEENNLYKIDIEHKQKIPQAKNITAFAFGNDNFYYIKEDGSKNTFMASSFPSEEGQIILDNLPSFKRAQIFVSFEKQIFLLLDETLYRVGDDLEKLTSNIKEIVFDQNRSNLTVVHEGELGYFSTFSGNLNFITRSILPLKNPSLKQEIDYAFFIKDNKIIAIELDLRDRQNEYVLYEGKDIKKFIVDEAGKQIWTLDGEELKVLKIR